jgi:bifunctional DNA-binding transcriptional regulator/antitoxin component of YhaV-PrlF toxin-antitoxin module
MKVDLDDIRCVTDTSITIRGSRRRMTVPSEVVELLNLNDGDKLRWIVFKNGDIQIQKVKNKKS